MTDIVDYLLDSRGQTEDERLGNLHTMLYNKASDLLKRHNPCQHSCKGCAGSDAEFVDSDERCCAGCKHLEVGKGCTAEEPLACKTWLCPPAMSSNPKVSQKLNRIARRAGKLGLYSFRGNRTSDIDRAKWQRQHGQSAISPEEEFDLQSREKYSS